MAFALENLKKFIPHSCVFCGRSRQRERVCQRCIGVLPWNRVFCEQCGQPVTSELPIGISCGACQKKSPLFVKARAPFHYAFPVDTALKAMKFRRQLVYAPAFAMLVLDTFKAEFQQCDALVAVPLHRWRHAKRGFNQAAELCASLVRSTNLPVITNVARTRYTKSQSGLTSAMRKKNLAAAFRVYGKLNARYPLIVDDVITTGTTCEYLALALLEAGAEKVSVLTVARSSQLV